MHKKMGRRLPSNPQRHLKWIVALLSYSFGIISFQLFHSEFFQTTSNQLLTKPCHAGRDSESDPNNPFLSLKRSFTSNSSKNIEREGDLIPTYERLKKGKHVAYAFLISGCDPSMPLSYRPYIWNILVATKNLIDSNSTADIVVMVQFSNKQQQQDPDTNSHYNSTTKRLELPPGDLQWLNLFPGTIRVHYLPPLLRDNFFNAQLAKFHVLQLKEYDRVLYLDADVMPLCNLDYLFDLSIGTETAAGRTQKDKKDLSFPILQPNVILAWFTEPSHGGFFLLEPGNYDEWEAIVERREQEALNLPYPHWDPQIGWGRELDEEWFGLPQPVILENDTRIYVSPRHSKNWTFHGDFADQGLLYFWTRFHRQAVSVVYLDKILDYGDEGRLLGTRSSEDVFHVNVDTNTDSKNQTRSCLPRGMEYPGNYGSTLHVPLFFGKIPHRDFCHFSGEKKPWEQARKKFPKSITEVRSSTDFWYFRLGEIFDLFGRQHPARKLPMLPLKYKKPSLGRYPTHRSMIGTIQKKIRKRQQQQQLEQS